MSELLVTVLRLSYLILLWVLVLSAVAVLRRDVFGTRVVQRGRRGVAARPAARPAAPRPSAARPAEGRGAVVGQPGPPPAPRARVSITGPGAAGAGVAVAPPETAPAEPTVRLAVVEGALTGTIVPLGASAVLIGRGPACTLVLTDDYASTRHARIYPHQGGWWVEDLDSTNGTFVDGERIDAPRELRPGVAVRIGQTVLELQG